MTKSVAPVEILSTLALEYVTQLEDGSLPGGVYLAKKYGISFYTVRKYLAEQGILRTQAQALETQKHKFPKKLTETQRSEIVDWYLSPLPNGSFIGSTIIARRYNISVGVIRDILLQAGVQRDHEASYSNHKQCRPRTNIQPPGAIPPICLCGCGQPVEWERCHNHWYLYVKGHPHLRNGESVQSRQKRKEWESIKSTIVPKLNRHMPMSGPDNPAWRGGTTPERQRLYKQGKWQEFVQQIYTRDGFHCVKCNHAHTGPRTLHCHHIQSWATNPDLRFDLDNCITLCSVCHNWVHSKANTEKAYIA
jgi:hypothetical protein